MSFGDYILLGGIGLENLARYFLKTWKKIPTRYTVHVMKETPSPAAKCEKK
jgi:hypothetical protein